MQKNSLKAEKREIFGRKVKTLRSKGLVPANIFGNKVKSLAIQVDSKEFSKVFSVAGETGIIEIEVGKEKRPTLVSKVQLDPVTDLMLHIDFKQVDLTKKVTANVPVELVGESPAVKQGLGTLIQHLDEIEVESLPTDLPDNIEVSVEKLENVGDSITVKSLNVGSKVTILDDSEKLVAAIEEVKEEVIEEVVEEESDQTEEAKGEEKEGTEEKEEESQEKDSTPEEEK